MQPLYGNSPGIPKRPENAAGSSLIMRRCCDLCCSLMDRDVALGSGTQGNNIASGLFGHVIELAHAIQLHLCFTTEPAKTQLLVNYICTTLSHACSRSWRAFLEQFSRISMNEILIRDIIPEGGRLKKINKNKTVQTFGLCPFLFPLLII